MALYDYRENTFEGIKTRMLELVDSDVDKREGSLIYNAVAAVASELEQCYIAIQTILDDVDPATASMDGLTLLGTAFGLVPKQATYAKIRAEFTFLAGYEPMMTGYSFTSPINKLTYTVGEPINDSTTVYAAYCDTVGTVGNISTAVLLPTSEIEGLASAKCTALEEAATEEETLSEFRQRYYNALRTKPFAGNIDYYKQVVGELDNVGGVQVHPCWNGGGTVNVCVISKSGGIFEYKDLQKFQNAVDPTHSDPRIATGSGLAPIDHDVTVSTPEIAWVNVSLKMEGDYATKDVYTAVLAYFTALKEDWSNPDDYGEYHTTVYRSQIISRVMNVSGVTNVSECLLSLGSATLSNKDITLNETASKADEEEKKPQLPSMNSFTINGQNAMVTI